MKVLVTNTVLLNGGDAAILFGLLRQLRHVFGQAVDIVVADTQADVARTLYPDLPIIAPLYHHIFPPKREGRFARLRGIGRFARWYSGVPRLYFAARLIKQGHEPAARAVTTGAEWATLEHYSTADMIVSTGGTYLVENYWLGPRLFDFRLALELGKPLVLYTQSIGTFSDTRTREALRRVFREAALILLRDQDSLANVRALAAPDKVATCLAADAAFALADAEVLDRAARSDDYGDRPRVAVSVRHWPYFRSRSAAEGMASYVEALARLVEHLVLERSARVVFISTCQGVPQYTYDDSATARDVRERLPNDVKEHVEVDGSYHQPSEIISSLKKFDLVVATRMHMAILGLVAGTPVLPIAYEFKTQALFRNLGMAQYVQDIEDLSSVSLIAAANEILDDLPGIRAALFPRVQDEYARAGLAEVCLRRALEPLKMGSLAAAAD